MNLVAFLDACVLYPAPVRDLLLSIAAEGVFRPQWSAKVQEEWSRNLLLKRNDLTALQLQGAIDAMNSAFPGANVENYESLIPTITIPDIDDRHVVAASVCCDATVIITYNLKDFPNTYLKNLGLTALHPDSLLVYLHEIAPTEVEIAFQKLVKRLKNPPQSREQVLDILTKNQLYGTVHKLQSPQ